MSQVISISLKREVEKTISSKFIDEWVDMAMIIIKGIIYDIRKSDVLLDLVKELIREERQKSTLEN